MQFYNSHYPYCILLTCVCTYAHTHLHILDLIQKQELEKDVYVTKSR